MIQKIYEIPDVWKFVCQTSESDFSFLNPNKLLCLYKNNTKEELLTSKSEAIEEWRNGYIINENQFYSEGKLESIFGDNIFKILIISDDELLVKSIDYEKEEIRYGIFNFSLKNVDWIVDFVGSRPRMLLNKENLVSTTDSSVNSFLLNDGNNWQKTYKELTNSDKANLHSKILSSDDRLFFVITGNERKGLFILDVETGKVLKKLDRLCYEIFKDDDYIYTTQFENILCRINTKTLECEKWDCNTLIREHGFTDIHDHRCTVEGGKFYFTQSLGDDNAKFGILDWTKQEMIFKYDFKPKNGAIKSIQLSESMISINMQDNTLHIFEKEMTPNQIL